MHTPQALSLWPQKGRRFPSHPCNPHPDWRAPHLFHMELRDLGDAKLWQLMEDLWQEVVHRELSASPMGPLLGCWRTLAGGGDPDVEDEEVTFLGERGWQPSRQPPLLTDTSLTEEDIGHLISTLASGYSRNKYFQWQCHTGKERRVLQTVVTQGTMHQGPLPRISSPGEYCQVVERGSGR